MTTAGTRARRAGGRGSAAQKRSALSPALTWDKRDTERDIAAVRHHPWSSLPVTILAGRRGDCP